MPTTGASQASVRSGADASVAAFAAAAATTALEAAPLDSEQSARRQRRRSRPSECVRPPTNAPTAASVSFEGLLLSLGRERDETGRGDW